MSISTYTELKTAVENWTDRDDLTARIPEFIDMAEAYLNDDLRVRSMLESTTITPSQSVAYVDLPTGFREVVSFVDANGDELIAVSPDDLADINRSSGEPEYYSITSRINFDCIAGAAYSFTMIYYKALDIATDLTNSVLTDYPNLYLYGALIQAEPFLKNEKRVDVWHQLYTKAMQTANTKAKRSRRKMRVEHPSLSQTFDIVRGY